MKLQYLFIIFALLLATASVTAEDGLIFSVDKPIEMKTACVVNGSYCSSPETSCNITAFYPKGLIYVNNVPLQNQFSFYNRTLPTTSVLGEYTAKVVCNDPIAGYSGTQDFTFKVTSTGTTGNGNLTIFILLLSASVVILIISLLLSNIYLGGLSGFAFILSGLYNNIYGIGIEQNMYTTGIGMIIIAVGITIMIMCGYNAMNSDSGFGRKKEDTSDENDTFNYTQEKEVDD